MQLTDTYLEMEDNEMEIDKNFSAIEKLPINKIPRPNIPRPIKFKKRNLSDVEAIGIITGNLEYEPYTPTRQSTPKSSPKSTPKVDSHKNKLSARRLF